MLQVLVGVGIWLTPPRRLARLKVDFGKRPRMVVIRLHQLSGVATALLLLSVAFTGLAMYWQDPAKALVEAATGSRVAEQPAMPRSGLARSEEHTSELQSLMRISSAVFRLKKKKKKHRK